MIIALHGILQQVQAAAPSINYLAYGYVVESASYSEGVWLYDYDANTYTNINNLSYFHNGVGIMQLSSSLDGLFLVGSFNSASSGSPLGLFSLDGGATWSYFATGAYWFGSTVSRNGSFGIVMRRHNSRNFYYSNNGGVNWVIRTWGSFSGFSNLPWTNSDGSFVLFCTSGSQLIYATQANIVGFSTVPITTFTLPVACFNVWTRPDSTTALEYRIWVCPVVSTTDLYYSDNSGSSWTAVTVDSGYTFTYSYLRGSDDGSVLYVMLDNGAANTGRFYKSTDNGATWTQLIPDAGYTGRFQVYQGDFCDPTGQFIFLGQLQTNVAYVSSDYGVTWIKTTNTGGTWGYGMIVYSIPETLLIQELFIGPTNNQITNIGRGSLAGNAWTETYIDSIKSANWIYSGNQGSLKYLTATRGIELFHAETLKSDVDIEFSVTAQDGANSRNIGILFRYVDGNNWIRLVIGKSSSGSWFALIQKRIAGVYTSIASATGITTMIGTYRITANGSAIEAYFNGSLIMSVTETDLQSATKHGLIFAWVSNGSTISNFKYNNFTLYEYGARP